MGPSWAILSRDGQRHPLGTPIDLAIRSPNTEVRIMGRRNDWNAVRMVAENIRLGDRSFWNMTMIPDLPTPGWKAIRELEEKGPVAVVAGRAGATPLVGPVLVECNFGERG